MVSNQNRGTDSKPILFRKNYCKKKNYAYKHNIQRNSPSNLSKYEQKQSNYKLEVVGVKDRGALPHHPTSFLKKARQKLLPETTFPVLLSTKGG